MWIRFVIYGLLGWCGEIIFTALPKCRPIDWQLRGHTFLWMFPIYGLIAPLYEPVHDALRTWPWPARGLVYTAGFIAVEFISGWMLARLIGRCPWDYSGKTRWHVRGFARLDYAPIWFAVGLALEPVHDFLLVLTPAIQAALSS
jgi:uncharacterized membrane protein